MINCKCNTIEPDETHHELSPPPLEPTNVVERRDRPRTESDYWRNAEDGDWCMVRWEPGRASWFNRATLLITGSAHHHDELIIRYNGSVYSGNASLPHFGLLNFAERVQSAELGELRYAIYRPTEYAKNKMLTQRIRERINATIRAWDAVPPRYDVRGVLSIGRSWMRARLPVSLKPILRHDEHSVWCTESCFAAYWLAGLCPMDAIGKQPLPSPIHAERLVWTGYLELVYDGGIAGAIQANQCRYASAAKNRREKDGAR